jgi:hypothetical protein
MAKSSGGWAQAVYLGVMFPALVVGGYLLGKVVGHWLGFGDAAPFIGGALGAAGAFVELFRWAARKDVE